MIGNDRTHDYLFRSFHHNTAYYYRPGRGTSKTKFLLHYEGMKESHSWTYLTLLFIVTNGVSTYLLSSK